MRIIHAEDRFGKKPADHALLDADPDRLYNRDEVRSMMQQAVEQAMSTRLQHNMQSDENLDNFNEHRSDEGGNRTLYSDTLLDDYIRQWLDTFKADSVKKSSYARLECSYRALQSRPIAQMRLADITAVDIQRYVNGLNSEGYSISTIKKQLRIVTAPLRQAAAMHEIPTDPTVGVRLPREERLIKKTREIRPYNDEEQERIWAVINAMDHPGVLAAGFMLETGLRAGELLALRWDKVDIPRKRISVEATIANPVGKSQAAYEHSTKSRSSTRIVPLTPRALGILERLQGRDETWVFYSPQGGWISYQNLIKHIKQVCRKADVPYTGAHTFRHTFATNCYYKGVDVKILSRLLGHSDVRITMNIYVALHGDGFDEMYAALVG